MISATVALDLLRRKGRVSPFTVSSLSSAVTLPSVGVSAWGGRADGGDAGGVVGFSGLVGDPPHATRKIINEVNRIAFIVSSLFRNFFAVPQE